MLNITQCSQTGASWGMLGRHIYNQVIKSHKRDVLDSYGVSVGVLRSSLGPPKASTSLSKLPCVYLDIRWSPIVMLTITV